MPWQSPLFIVYVDMSVLQVNCTESCSNNPRQLPEWQHKKYFTYLCPFQGSFAQAYTEKYEEKRYLAEMWKKISESNED